VTPSIPVHRLKREARLLSRSTGIPLHAALDRIAAREGFSAWSLLAARTAALSPAARLYARLAPGDLVLLGARPRQGKTLMGLQLAREATRAGRHSLFFTLEYAEADIHDRLAVIGAAEMATERLFAFDCSDAIDAGYMIDRLATAPAHTLVVIDYLQLLDQRRDSPPLADQVRALKTFARVRGLVLIFIAQIDRGYDPAQKPFPTLADVRLPNPLDLTLFDTACFLNGGEIRFGAVA
jgi:replicative DNA helicase